MNISQGVHNLENIHIEQSIHRFTNIDAEIITDLWVSSGKPNKLLVMLNGYQRPRTDFRTLRRKLHKLLPNIATMSIDNRGSGESQALANNAWDVSKNGIETMANDAHKAINYAVNLLKINRIELLGISMGGMIAQELCRKCNNINSAVFISTMPFGGDATTTLITNKQNEEANIAEQHDNFLAYFGKKILKEKEIFVESFIKTIIANKSSQNNTAANWQKNAIENFDSRNWLKNIEVPTLIVHGSDDHISPLHNAIYLQQQLKKSQLKIYQEVGHLILIENSESLVTDLKEFLTS